MHWLAGIHAFFGEIGVVCFLWILVEFMSPNKEGLCRSQKVSSIGLGAILLAWLMGGMYYFNFYSSQVKPTIKGSDFNWAHIVVMELKEHVFLFLPFLAFFLWITLKQTTEDNMQKRRSHILGVSLIGTLIGFAMAFMGALVSYGYRLGLEAKL